MGGGEVLVMLFSTTYILYEIHVAENGLPAFRTVIHSDDGLGIDFNNMHVNFKILKATSHTYTQLND